MTKKMEVHDIIEIMLVELFARVGVKIKNYDEALAILGQADTEDVERIGGFLQAFSTMISEVKAREEAYQEEVEQLRIIIDEKKRDRQVQAIESSDSFQYLVKEAKRLRARKRKPRD